MKRLLLITDAWEPQVNGVVRTLQTTIKNLYDFEIATTVIHPGLYNSFALPMYKEIRIPYRFDDELEKVLIKNEFDYVHISVEGALGWAARGICIRHGIKFTTTYHTKFPEYLNARFFVPLSIGYSVMRKFHEPSSCVMVATNALKDELITRGFKNNFSIWTRGVDTTLFTPKLNSNIIAPYALYVGRVSTEKNIEAFLSCDLGHLTKVVVGDGPHLEKLKKKYPTTIFAGKHSGDSLVSYYQNASVFVFPSKTDTFGLVMIEALACGTPVAGFNEPNVKDIITEDVGCYSDNLTSAIWTAMGKDRSTCVEYIRTNFTWSKATEQFVSNLKRAF